tara:strand:- start:34 stop:177 length:144 start_codon:yes stop_codon:yes gene_type:complete
MDNDYITSLAQVSCEEQFTEDLNREYQQRIDEREQEWERTMAYADNL